jgi:prepilin-type N-terminal cleavage/methylation domain-containing protein
MNSTATIPSKSRAARGFTLVEIMVVTAVVAVVVGGTIALVRQALQTNAYDTGRIQVNNDMLKLTDGLATDAVYSNYFIIYPNFSTRSITSGSGSSAVTADDIVTQGFSGDMVVLVTVSTNVTTGATTPTNIVGYYRDSSVSTTAGPVRRFSFPVTTTLFPGVTLSSTPIYVLLNATNGAPIGSDATNPVVIPLALGENSGDLFFNYGKNSIMLKSQIEEPGNLYQGAQSTYNFTVSPRG